MQKKLKPDIDLEGLFGMWGQGKKIALNPQLSHESSETKERCQGDITLEIPHKAGS